MTFRSWCCAAVLLVGIVISVLSVHPQAQNGAVPRRADGRPDLSGVWMPPYVPDMTVNRGASQRGYAEPPFSPDDTPQVQQAFAARGQRAELREGRIKTWTPPWARQEK